jgi:hypothetical protein
MVSRPHRERRQHSQPAGEISNLTQHQHLWRCQQDALTSGPCPVHHRCPPGPGVDSIAARWQRAVRSAALVKRRNARVGRACGGWRGSHARRALTPRAVRPRAARCLINGAEIIAALWFCWAVLGVPTGKGRAPIMAELVPRLRRFQELVITDRAGVAGDVARPDWTARLAPDGAQLLARGRSHTKPGSLLKNRSRSDVGGVERRRAGATGPSMGAVRTVVRRGRRADLRWAGR